MTLACHKPIFFPFLFNHARRLQSQLWTSHTKSNYCSHHVGLKQNFIFTVDSSPLVRMNDFPLYSSLWKDHLRFQQVRIWCCTLAGWVVTTTDSCGGATLEKTEAMLSCWTRKLCCSAIYPLWPRWSHIVIFTFTIAMYEMIFLFWPPTETMNVKLNMALMFAQCLLNSV